MPQFNDNECSSSCEYFNRTNQNFFLICFKPDSVTYYGRTPIYAWSRGFTYGPEGSHTEGHTFWELMSGLGKTMEGA